MAGGEPGADYAVLFLREAQAFEVDDLDVLHLIHFKEIDDLPNCWQLALLKEFRVSPSVFMHLRTVAPHEVFLGSFHQSCREIAELSFKFLLLSFGQDVFSIHDVVLLAVCELRSFFCWVRLELFHRFHNLQ